MDRLHGGNFGDDVRLHRLEQACLCPNFTGARDSCVVCFIVTIIWTWILGFWKDMTLNHALQQTQHGVVVCNRGVP